MNEKMPYTPLSTHLSGSARETEIRLKQIFSGPKKRPPALFLALVFAACVFCGNLVSCQNAELETEINEKDGSIEIESSDQDDLIRSYIAYLADINTSAQTGDDTGFYCETPGMGTGPSQQHDLIASQFGAGAWDHVSYTAEEIEPVDGSLGYQVIMTGEFVSEEEYNQILKRYWEDVAESEGISYDDLFLSEHEPIESMGNKRVDILNKYVDNIPVKLIVGSDSQTYNVFLAFGGETVSKEGFRDFHFVIDNRKGSWKVFQGLSWNEPSPEYPKGD